MGAAPAEHVHIQLVGLGQEQVGLAANEREALQEADADAAVGHHLGDGEGGGLDIEAALDDLEVGGYCSQVFVGVSIGEVAEAYCLSDLPRREEFLKLQRQKGHG